MIFSRCQLFHSFNGHQPRVGFQQQSSESWCIGTTDSFPLLSFFSFLLISFLFFLSFFSFLFFSFLSLSFFFHTPQLERRKCSQAKKKCSRKAIWQKNILVENQFSRKVEKYDTWLPCKAVSLRCLHWVSRHTKKGNWSVYKRCIRKWRTSHCELTWTNSHESELYTVLNRLVRVCRIL